VYTDDSRLFPCIGDNVDTVPLKTLHSGGTKEIAVRVLGNQVG